MMIHETRKKNTFRGSFFFFAPSAPPSQLDRPCAPPDVPLTTGSTLRLSTYSFELSTNMDDRSTLQVRERWVNSLPDEASSTKWEPEKKDPLRGAFFSYQPLAGAAPQSVPTQQTVYIVAPTLQLQTFSLAKPFLSNTT